METVVSDETFTELVDPIQRAHPDCIILNHQDLYADRDSLFADPNHLLIQGAIVWSDRMKSDLARHNLLHE